jgi:hypothetical protein
VPYLWRNQFSSSFFLFRKVGVTKKFSRNTRSLCCRELLLLFLDIEQFLRVTFMQYKGSRATTIIFFLNRRFSDLQKDIKLHGLNKTRIYIVISGAASFSGL